MQKIMFLWWSENCSQNERNFIFCIEEIFWIFFADFRLVFMASDFEHKFFASFDLIMNSLGGLEFFDEFSRKCRAFKILIRA